MKGLTEKQASILDAGIRGLLRDQSFPTTRQLCTVLGVTSTNGMCEHLKALKKKGYIEKAGRRVRVLRWPDGTPFSLAAVSTPASD